MSFVKPFAPQGNTISLTTSGTPSTVQSMAVTPANFGMSGNTTLPCQYMLISNGTADIWVVFAPTAALAAAAALPTPGTTTVGTPTLGFRLKPGVIMIVSWGGPTLFIGNLSTAASQNFDITPGEGS
jgi:hypothetical protein